jgi:ADP-heptose:LPS heptosyltransferase
MYKQVPLMLRLCLAGRHGCILKEAQSILIVNNGLIGEFFASLPAVRHLLDETNAEVDMIVAPPLEPLARGMLGIKTVFSRHSVYRRVTEHWTNRPESFKHYDCVVVLQLSKDTYKLLKNIGYGRIKLALGTYLKYAVYIAGLREKNSNLKQLEEVLFDVLEVQRKKRVEFNEVFRFFNKDYESIASFPFLKAAVLKKIIIHTGSGWPVKLWQNNRWVELLNIIHTLGSFQFIFVGGTEKEASDFQDIGRQLPFAVYSLIKKVDLRELALIMKHSDYFIGVDSGPRHIAHFLNLPSVSLLGPGPKIYNPQNRNAVVIDRSECFCSNLCCFKKERCMDRIRASDVVIGFEKVMKDTPVLQLRGFPNTQDFLTQQSCEVPCKGG